LGIASNKGGGFITEIDPGGLSYVKRRVCLILHCGPDDKSMMIDIFTYNVSTRQIINVVVVPYVRCRITNAID
jgi:hypothetical protein